MVWFIPLLIAGAQAAMAKKASKAAGKAQGKAQASADAIENEKLALSRRQQAQADEQYARYQSVYVPIEDQLIRDATRKVNPDVQAGLASADVEGQLATARGALSRNLARRGINPADGAVADAESRLALGGGLGRAAAMTAARRNAVADQTQRLSNVAAMGRSLPGTAYNFSTQAGAGLSDINATRAARLNYQNAIAGEAGGELGLSLADVLNKAPAIIDGFNQWNDVRGLTRPKLTTRLPLQGMAA